MRSMTSLLPGLVLGLLTAVASAQGAFSVPVAPPVPDEPSAYAQLLSQKSPAEIRALMQEHMVRRPYAAIDRSLLLTGAELHQVRELLELHASTTFQRHLAAERDGKPGMTAVIGKQLEAEQRLRQAEAEGLLETNEDQERGYDYLPITVIDELVRILPPARSKQFLQQLGTEKRIQLSRLGKRRALAFKLAVPKMRAAMPEAQALQAFLRGPGYQTYGSAQARNTNLFGGRGRRGGRAAGRGLQGGGGLFGNSGGQGNQGAQESNERGNGFF